MADPNELAILSRQYRDYARFELSTHGSPIYAAICARLADQPEIGGLALLARPGFRTPLILLAAVHHLLLSGVQHRLAAYYPSLAGPHPRPIDDDLYPAFAELVRAHRGALEHVVATRTTQTNEARRTVLLVPALGLVATASPRPVALLEVGASAGLNLLLDRYGFTIGGVALGDAGSPVQVECAVTGPINPPLPAALPQIAWRAGLDLNPLDVRDPGTVAWLRALIWPEHIDRMATLEAAVSIARTDAPRMVRGDLVDDLPGLAAEAQRDAVLVVTDTWVLAYVTAERRVAFIRGLRETAATLQRTIWLVAFEAREVTADLGVGLTARPADGTSGFTVLSLHRFEPDGGSDHRLLAECHAHGRWIRWLESPAAGAA